MLARPLHSDTLKCHSGNNLSPEEFVGLAVTFCRVLYQRGVTAAGHNLEPGARQVAANRHCMCQRNHVLVAGHDEGRSTHTPQGAQENVGLEHVQQEYLPVVFLMGSGTYGALIDLVALLLLGPWRRSKYRRIGREVNPRGPQPPGQTKQRGNG